MTRQLVVSFIRAYQRLVSPVLRFYLGPGTGCRYHPSCSNYAISALSQYGLWRGSVLSVMRVMRCSPFFAGGYDPLPRRRTQI